LPLRVVERSSGIPVAYAARLLGASGADVVKIEPLGGDPLRRSASALRGRHGEPLSALFEYLNCFKRSVTIDAGSASGSSALRRLMATADVVFDSADGDPGALRERYELAAAGNARVAYVALSGFGLTGPYRGFRSNDFVDLATGGFLYITGEAGREPLAAGGPWAGYLVGTLAAAAALAAVRRARASGRGQLVDVGAMEALASFHQWTLTLYTHQGVVKRRAGNRHAESYHPMGPLPCRDGWVCVGIATVPQWEGFCLAIGAPGLLADERFQTGGDRFDHADELDAIVVPKLREMTAGDLVARLQEHRVPASPALTVLDLLADRQLASRGYWARNARVGDRAVLPERAFRVPGACAPFRAAPRAGEHTEEILREVARERDAASPVAPETSGDPGTASRAASIVGEPGKRGFLAGVRVLEFSIAWAGPFAGRFLADLGAEVIKVEHPTARGAGVTGAGGFRANGDLAGWRWGQLPGPVFRSGIYPDADPGERPWNRQGIYNKMNRNKRSLCIDLKAAGARDVLADLVRASDVVLDNYSPRGVKSLGIDHESLALWNPRIISVSLSGYGHTGPDRMRVSWGPILESHSGMAAMTGYAGAGPVKMGVALPDPVGGLHCAVAVLTALAERDRTGRGFFVDISQLETYAAIGGDAYLTASATGAAPPRRGNRSPERAPQGVYPCAGDDEWLAISIESDAEWRALCGVVGERLDAASCPSRAERLANHDEIDRAIAAWSAGRDKQEAMRALQAAGVRAAAVMTNRDIVEDQHIAARGFMVEWDQADVGRRRFPGFPIHFSDPEEIPMRGAPPLGADNRYVLVDVLGYPEARLASLAETGVIATAPPES
jgi:crotonobetainyl-CoA:carnitine CoA-transferase CaiB-like acyl-CoA transferase